MDSRRAEERQRSRGSAYRDLALVAGDVDAMTEGLGLRYGDVCLVRVREEGKRAGQRHRSRDPRLHLAHLLPVLSSWLCLYYGTCAKTIEVVRRRRR